MDWHQYQEQSAELFRSLGCKAEVDKVIHGARGTHKIDVWVTRSVYGMDHHWAVECKHWNSPVTKEKAVVLKGIVDDVGADRGILLSSSGFQSGAVAFSEYSNITLSSLDDLRESVRAELQRYTVASLEEKLVKVLDGLHALSIFERNDINGYIAGTMRYKPGVDGKAVMEAGGKLSTLDSGFRSIKVGKDKFPLFFEEDGNTLAVTNDIVVFLEHASRIITECEGILAIQQANVEKNA